MAVGGGSLPAASVVDLNPTALEQVWHQVERCAGFTDAAPMLNRRGTAGSVTVNVEHRRPTIGCTKAAGPSAQLIVAYRPGARRAIVPMWAAVGIVGRRFA